jgi:hypothetical protein
MLPLQKKPIPGRFFARYMQKKSVTSKDVVFVFTVALSISTHNCVAVGGR